MKNGVHLTRNVTQSIKNSKETQKSKYVTSGALKIERESFVQSFMHVLASNVNRTTSNWVK